MSTADEIVQVCTQMIACDGVAKLSLRKVAAQVGIKAPSIYEHFRSKDHLLSEVRRRAATALHQALMAQSKGNTPREQLLGMAEGYQDFACTQPALFALFFAALPSDRINLADNVSHDSPYAVLLDCARRVLGDSSADAEGLCFGVWALVHGAAVLRQTHLRNFAHPVVAEATRQALGALLDGWLARTAPSPAAQTGFAVS
ncbi:MAG: TetR/AcrR family transcriptional regulator [Rhodoferax sp.]|nr:TetR/AcrR family transcriptional regulator [Rhodoferax sp.]